MTNPVILVATWNSGLFALTGSKLTSEIPNQPVRGLAHDSIGGALAIVGSHSLCRRAPNGDWATIASSDLELSCCLSVPGAIYVGTDNARMLRLSDSGNAFNHISSFDHVEGRDSWFAGSAIVNGQRIGPPLGVRSLAANSNATILFANVHVGGIPRSLDAGNTWQPTIDIHCDVHEVRAHSEDPTIIAAATAVGLCISRDAGATWITEQQGLHATYCSAVAFSGNDIFFSAATSHFATEGRIYRRPIAPDASPVTVDGGMPPWIEGIADTGCIATNGSFVAIVDRAGNLYTSQDFGHAWSCFRTGRHHPVAFSSANDGGYQSEFVIVLTKSVSRDI